MQPPVTDPALVASLRHDLASAAYGVDGVEDLLGPLAAAALHREQSLPARRAVPRRWPASRRRTGIRGRTLAALFLLGLPVPRAALDRALPTTGAQGAERLGLVAAQGSGTTTRCAPSWTCAPTRRSTAAARSTGGSPPTWASWPPGGRLRTDHVLGVGGASTTLAQVTVRNPTAPRARPGHRLRHPGAARVAALRRVVGTDISRRALAFARFNAALNARRCALELRHGSMLEPVAGERFDLVV